MGAAAKPKHRHRPERVSGTVQLSFPFAWKPGGERPLTRGACEPCPECQRARDLGVTPLTCGHRGIEVLWHSRPCIVARCRYSLRLNVAGEVVFLNARWAHGEGCESCALDVADRGPQSQDDVMTLLGLCPDPKSRRRFNVVERRAFAKMRAGMTKGWQ